MYSLSLFPKQKHSIYPLMVNPRSCSPTSSHSAQTVLNRPSLGVKRGAQASRRINSCLNLKPCKKCKIHGEMLENSPWRLALLPTCQKWVSYGESETQTKGQVQQTEFLKICTSLCSPEVGSFSGFHHCPSPLLCAVPGTSYPIIYIPVSFPYRLHSLMVLLNFLMNNYTTPI